MKTSSIPLGFLLCGILSLGAQDEVIIDGDLTVNGDIVGNSTVTVPKIEATDSSATINGNSGNYQNAPLRVGTEASGKFTIFDDNEIQQFGNSLFLRGEYGIRFFTGDIADGNSREAMAIYPTYLDVLPQNDFQEGGEIRLKGASTFPGWVMDSFYNRFRVLQWGGTSVEIWHNGPTDLYNNPLRLWSGHSGDDTEIHFLDKEDNTFRSFFWDDSTDAFMVEGDDGNFGRLLHENGNGDVGIGTTAPTEKLEVAGNVKVTADLTVGGNALINAQGDISMGAFTSGPTP